MMAEEMTRYDLRAVERVSRRVVAGERSDGVTGAKEKQTDVD